MIDTGSKGFEYKTIVAAEVTIKHNGPSISGYSSTVEWSTLSATTITATTISYSGTSYIGGYAIENPSLLIINKPKEITPDDLWNKDKMEKIAKVISAEAKKQTPEQNAEIAKISEKYKKIREEETLKENEETLKEEIKTIKEKKAKKNNVLANAIIDRFEEIGLLNEDLGNETMDVLEKFVQVFSEEIINHIKKSNTKTKQK